MKILIVIFLLVLTQPVDANGRFWISNKLEVGYDKAFVSNQIRFDRDEVTRNSLASGLRFRVSDTTTFKAFYLLENVRKHSWKSDHFLGAQFEFKLQ